MSDRIIKIDLNALPDRDPVDRRQEVQELFKNIKERLPELESILAKYSVDFTPGMGEASHWMYEDPIYRFFHHSIKVVHLQDFTIEIVSALQSLLPGHELNKMFMQIFQEGTAIKSVRVYKTDPEDGVPLFDINANWMQYTRPILEAFFHAKFFLEMAVKYGKTLEYPPCSLPSGWAALLYLYN